jgi:hypothetical protein
VVEGAVVTGSRVASVVGTVVMLTSVVAIVDVSPIKSPLCGVVTGEIGSTLITMKLVVVVSVVVVVSCRTVAPVVEMGSVAAVGVAAGVVATNAGSVVAMGDASVVMIGDGVDVTGGTLVIPSVVVNVISVAI